MGTRSTEAALEGKTSSDHADVQGADGNFPVGYEWLVKFDSEERLGFYRDVLCAIAQARENGHWSEVADLVDAWRETGIERDEEDLQRKLQDARHELAEGGGHSWQEVRKELDM